MGDDAEILYEHQLGWLLPSVTGSSKQVTDLSHVYAISAVMGVLKLWEKLMDCKPMKMYNCGDRRVLL